MISAVAYSPMAGRPSTHELAVLVPLDLRRHARQAPANTNNRSLLFYTEVRLLYHRIISEVLGGIRQHDLARLKDITAIGHRQRH